MATLHDQIATLQLPPLHEEQIELHPLRSDLSPVPLTLIRVERPDQAQTVNPAQTDVWAFVWGCSLVLSELLLATELKGLQVLEVGAGLGLASVACGLAGADVTLSDCVLDALAVADRTIQANAVAHRVQCLHLNWYRPAELLHEQYDLVIGSEVLYMSNVLRPLAHVVRTALKPDGVLVLADAGRGKAEDFLGILDDEGLESELIEMQAIASGVCVVKVLNILVAWRVKSARTEAFLAQIRASCDYLMQTRHVTDAVQFGYCLDAKAESFPASKPSVAQSADKS
eukprot:TRINITY_DN3714_c0_g1_i2.p2 TRINITY_DN3714_c0_g1~~TRINITY_DN3714_c0_g1_i2.p2  ORF type:complete len:285 (-),score=81.44 TRINITY_DN3714_c0_g1_i2:652-1506(-)